MFYSKYPTSTEIKHYLHSHETYLNSKISCKALYITYWSKRMRNIYVLSFISCDFTANKTLVAMQRNPLSTGQRAQLYVCAKCSWVRTPGMKTSDTALYLSLMFSFFWHISQLNSVYQLDTAVSGRDGRIYIHLHLLRNLSRQNALTQLGKFVKNTGTATMFPLFWKAPHDFQFLRTNKKIHSACGFKIVLNIRYFRWMQDAGFETE